MPWIWVDEPPKNPLEPNKLTNTGTWVLGRPADTVCQHDKCEKCHGSGIDKNGRACVHMISCRCPRCSPRCTM